METSEYTKTVGDLERLPCAGSSFLIPKSVWEKLLSAERAGASDIAEDWVGLEDLPGRGGSC